MTTIDLEGGIAAFVASLDERALDEAVLPPLRDAVLDCLSAILSGAREEVSGHVLAVAAADGPASVVGRGVRTSVEGAALVNGTMAHASEYDDISESVWGHATAPVLPAVLAVAEWKNLSARQLLVALLAGIEVECKIGFAVTPLHYERGWHSTGTVTLPLAKTGIAVGAVFAFVMSFDEVAVSMFLSDPFTMTLPLALLTETRANLTPTIAAASVVFMMLTVVLIYVLDRLVNLDRLVGQGIYRG